MGSFCRRSYQQHVQISPTFLFTSGNVPRQEFKTRHPGGMRTSQRSGNNEHAGCNQQAGFCGHDEPEKWRGYFCCRFRTTRSRGRHLEGTAAASQISPGDCSAWKARLKLTLPSFARVLSHRWGNPPKLFLGIHSLCECWDKEEPKPFPSNHSGENLLQCLQEIFRKLLWVFTETTSLFFFYPSTIFPSNFLKALLLKIYW